MNFDWSPSVHLPLASSLDPTHGSVPALQDLQCLLPCPAIVPFRITRVCAAYVGCLLGHMFGPNAMKQHRRHRGNVPTVPKTTSYDHQSWPTYLVMNAC
jgi:hypothetical protein